MGVISLDLQQTDAGYDVKKEIERLDQEIDDEVAARVAADTSIWEEIETIEAASDVVDVVGTYEALENYDTSKLQDNDLIKVLQDETRDDAITYYRWNKTSSAFIYVGSEGPYYTASETDTLLAAKQDTLIAGDNITIAADGKTISATDTTYTHFTGATASADGTAGLVPAPIAGDEDKVLKGDGTWGTASPSYTAGTGIDITNDTISVDTTVVATQTDLSGKQDALTAGTNVQINNNVISATDTTYSNFVGTDGTTAGVAGLVPAPAVTDDDKYLKSDGTWTAVPNNPGATVVYLKYTSGTYYLWADRNGTTAVSIESLYQATINSAVIVCLVDSGGNPSDVYAEIVASNKEPEIGSPEYANYAFYINSASPNSGNPKKGSSYVAVLYNNELHCDGTSNAFRVAYGEIQQKLTAGSNITISGSTISARDTTYSAFGGATSQVAGTAGLVPAPAIGDDTKYLKGDGTWATVQSGSPTTMFYVDIIGLTTYTATTINLYTDDTLTTAITPSQLAAAYAAGPVVINCTHNQVSYGFLYVVGRVENQDSSGNFDYTVVSYLETGDGQGHFTAQPNTFVITANESLDSAPMDLQVFRMQGKLIAGTNISINDLTNTISATDTTYTAGSGIAISAQNVISASPNNISSNDWSGLWQ